MALTSISAGKIVVAGLDSGVTARMFSNGTAQAAIEGWRHSSDLTLIDGGDIYTGSVTASKITAASLSAIASLTGNIKTAASGARVDIFPDSSTGFKVVDNSGNNVFECLVGGTDVGDVTIGNYAGGQGIKYDKSAGAILYKNLKWSEISDDDGNKPDNNATDGATFGDNITGGGSSNSQCGNDGFVTRYEQTIFGDGSDGDVTISSNTTMSSDMYYNNLTVNTGVTLTTGGYRLFVRNTLTLNLGSIVGYRGNAGTDGTNGTAGFPDVPLGSSGTPGAAGSPGAALAENILGGAPAGAASGMGGAGGTSAGGSVGIAGTSGTSVAKSYCGSGTGGSAGGSGGNSRIGYSGASGGAAGTGGSTSGTVYNKPHNVVFAIRLYDDNGSDIIRSAGGTAGSGGGGGGGGDNVYPNGRGGGGGGAGGCGSGGGVVMISARIIVNNGSISARGGYGGDGGNGGKGGNGGAASGYDRAGGGGGGGAGGAGGRGGLLVLIYTSYSGSGVKTTAGGGGGTGGNGGAKGEGTTDADDGFPGTAGAAGSNGSTGQLIELEV
ncbi:hypothetical protein [Candidatus Magnetobacterium casense]|uniref:PE-PGRS family protein n=1 Tax=Candidatus Magnetobacterium casense TaxID=1455061 RepID=A0ABS6RU15_9BACT|nr:hypothetical protein [Candidatus Magnetobacterium casensis]MBV6340109.1 hypothetical protein [Candidatus Magnetobacterium casensis]